MKNFFAVILVVMIAMTTFAQEPIEKILVVVKATDSIENAQIYSTGKMTAMLSNSRFVLMDAREDSILRVYLDRHPEGYLDSVSDWNMERGLYVPYSISNYMEIKLSPTDKELLAKVIEVIFTGNESYHLKGCSIFTGVSLPKEQREYSAMAPSAFQSFLQNNVTLVTKKDFLLTSRLEEEYAERVAAGFQESPLMELGIYRTIYDIVKIMGDGVDQVGEVNKEYKLACDEFASMLN
ncbi:MAG: hypothetical protein K9M44_03305 [Candidatus Pacebacteria bacterium]|nr:hypothetical protein [Candidatus Paceibacterota bacterium]